MNGWFLRLYVHEGHRHRGKLVWEWLLQTGADLGLRGGSAFRAVGGFGRHHVLHEQTFFELAGSVAVEIEFIVTDEEARRLLEQIRQHHLRLFCTRTPIQFGILNPDREDEDERGADVDEQGAHASKDWMP